MVAGATLDGLSMSVRSARFSFSVAVSSHARHCSTRRRDRASSRLLTPTREGPSKRPEAIDIPPWLQVLRTCAQRHCVATALRDRRDSASCHVRPIQ